MRLLGASILLFFIANTAIFPNISPLSQTLSGFVYSAETLEPIAGVRVKSDSHTNSTNTDSLGYFNLKIECSENCTLDFYINGYSRQKLKIKLAEEGSNLKVLLKPLSFKSPSLYVYAEETSSDYQKLAEHEHILEGKKLQREISQTIASTLKNEVGLAVRSMGPAPARPVIRGLSSDRVSINEDGAPANDLSATSPDHAMASEPFSVDRIELFRGAKTLLYSSNAVGGVVNIVQGAVPEDIYKQQNLEFGSYYESANSGGLGMIKLETPALGMNWKATAVYKQSENLRTGKGVLENSSADNLNLNIGSAYHSDDFSIGAAIGEYRLNYGIPGGFVGAHPDGVNIEMTKRTYQTKGRLHLHSETFDDLRFQIVRTYYFHQEFESDDLIGASFLFKDYSGRLELFQHESSFFRNGIMGAAFSLRESSFGGYVFTPPTRSIKLAPFIYEEFTLFDINFQSSARLNYDLIDPIRVPQNPSIGAIRKREFASLSASLTAIKPLDENFSIGANFSLTNRHPNAEELFSEGPHLAAYSFEVGNPDLDREQGIGYEIFGFYKTKNLYLMLTGFYYDYANFITPRNTGDTNFAQLLPIFATYQAPATLSGVESRVAYNTDFGLEFETNLAYTNGRFKDTKTEMPMIPPLRIATGISYSGDNFKTGVETEWKATQNRVDEFEEPTPEYFITSIYFQTFFNFEDINGNIAISLDNVFDRVYYNHLSRIKSIMPEVGRNLRANFRLYL